MDKDIPKELLDVREYLKPLMVLPVGGDTVFAGVKTLIEDTTEQTFKLFDPLWPERSRQPAGILFSPHFHHVENVCRERSPHSSGRP